MNKTAIPLLICAADCLAHPGHGAPLIHTHGWDWANVWFWIGVAVVAAVAAWRAKSGPYPHASEQCARTPSQEAGRVDFRDEQ